MIRIDAPPIEDEAEATALVLHHLRLAAAYFEALPDPFEPDGWDEYHCGPAMKAWLAAMEALYPDED